MPEYLDLSHFFPGRVVRAGMTNYSWNISINDSYNELAGLLGLDPDRVVSLGQTHSNNVLQSKMPGKYDNHDAAVTSLKDLVLTIRVADCIPFLIYDPINHNRGVVHAGWRGVQNGIIRNSLKQMVDNGSDPADIIILGGPSLQKCCFEIGPEVAEMFDDKFLEEGNGDRYYLDSFGAAIQQFIDFGVGEKQIISINECTKCTDHKYHSYRRDGVNSGRMIAMIGLVKE